MTRDVSPSRFRRTIAGLGATLMAIAIGLHGAPGSVIAVATPGAPIVTGLTGWVPDGSGVRLTLAMTQGTDAPPSMPSYSGSDPYNMDDDGYQIKIDGGQFGPAFNNTLGTFPSDYQSTAGTVAFRALPLNLDTEHSVTIRGVIDATTYGADSATVKILKPSTPITATFVLDATDPSTALLEFTPVPSASIPSGFTYSYEWSTDYTNWNAIQVSFPVTSNVSISGVADPDNPTVSIRTVATKTGVFTIPNEMNATDATPPTVAPGAPTGVTATAGDGRATVEWTAPTSNGGAPITSYTAQVVGSPSLTCTTADGTATSCEIAGLTNGTAYTFEVIATNSQGNSAPSTASAAITPAASSTETDTNTDSNTESSNDSDTSTDTSTNSDTTPNGETSTNTGTESTDGESTASDDPIAAPATATTSEAVTAEDAAALANEPGDGTVIVDGTPVTPTVSRVTDDAVETPPAERTPEQVAAVQAAARTLVEGFNELAGDDSPIEVTNTDTGAVITGLLTNPDDPDTPVEVPAERVLVMTAGDVAVMMVATGTDGTPLALDDGSLQVTGDGNVAVALAGLPASTAGEIVLLPSRTVIGTFTTTADGTLVGEVVMPTDLAAGHYGIAIAVGTTRTSIGVKALPSTAVLPATGGENAPATMALALFALGMLLVVSGRRRTSAH